MSSASSPTARAVPIRRLRDQPIVPAAAVARYGAIFNAGLVHHGGRFHLFARGVRDGYRRNVGPGPRFVDYVSDILVFESVDGHDYQFRYVLAASGEATGVHCFEDPRVQVVRSAGRDHLVMTYTNLPHPSSGDPWRIGAHRIHFRDERFWLDDTSAALLGPAGVANKDAVVFNLADERVALIHRIHPHMQLAVFEDLEHLWTADETYWAQHLQEIDSHVIIRKSEQALGVGAGAPPVAVPEGLLLFFHERDNEGVYTMQVALLDHATGRVTAQLGRPLLAPELEWERVGDVDDVIFVQGAHLLDDDTIYVTYGAADRCVGAAIVSAGELMAAFGLRRASPRPSS